MIQIHTDGACKGNPGVGGWGVVVLRDGKEQEIFGAYNQTTNNRMELIAVIRGLEALGKTNGLVTVFSDSTYVVSAVNKGWLATWQANGWRTADKKQVKNIDLWRKFLQYYDMYKPAFQWVKGHSGDKYNERCDALSNKAIEESEQVVDAGYEGKKNPPEQLSLF